MSDDSLVQRESGAGSSPPEGRPPAVSVVIVADLRKIYLREAVESVVAQDLPRTDFEILVVKNFSDATIDAFLASVDAKNVVAPDLRGAPKMAAAVRQSRGQVLAFLDYDDRWRPGRLRRIRDTFAGDPELGLYHNRFEVIGDDGRPVHSGQLPIIRTPRAGGEGPRRFGSGASRDGYRPLASERPDFNSSSFALLRSVLQPALPYLDRMNVAGDTMLFFAGLASQRPMLFDDEVFTEYRVHAQNSTLAGEGTPDERRQRLARFAVEAARDYRIIREFMEPAGRDDLLKLIDARICVNDLTLAFRSPRTGRRDFVRLLRRLWRFYGTYPVKEDLWGVVGAAAFVISPSLGRRVYDRRMSVR
jgi:glycosyltransferase involved in cell wall biosynthesis